jgi:hypothetical protein
MDVAETKPNPVKEAISSLNKGFDRVIELLISEDVDARTAALKTLIRLGPYSIHRLFDFLVRNISMRFHLEIYKALAAFSTDLPDSPLAPSVRAEIFTNDQRTFGLIHEIFPSLVEVQQKRYEEELAVKEEKRGRRRAAAR